MIRTLTLLAATTLLALPSVADTIHLKNGGTLEGQVLRREKGRIHVRIASGTTIVREADVSRIERSLAPIEAYAERAKGLAFTDVAAHYALATWCRNRGLKKQMRKHLELVVAAEPDHAGARKLLDHMKVGKRWFPRYRAMLELGYVQWKGTWVRPDQLTRIQRDAAARARQARVKAQIDALMKRLAGADDAARDAARDGLVALAQLEAMPQLAEVAGQAYDGYSGYWAERRRVMTDIRADIATIQQPMRELTLFLGGTSTLPINLQLPAVTHTSVNTTTAIPAGR